MKTEKKTDGYSYAIIKENYPDLERLTVLSPEKGETKYNPKKKYAMIVKGVHKDHSESIYFIVYSNDLENLHNRAKKYPSWYNYPIGLTKNMQGYIREIN
jgi:hypothetical protein